MIDFWILEGLWLMRTEQFDHRDVMTAARGKEGREGERSAGQRRAAVGGGRLSFARIRAGHLNPAGRGPSRLRWGLLSWRLRGPDVAVNNLTIRSTITDDGSNPRALPHPLLYMI